MARRAQSYFKYLGKMNTDADEVVPLVNVSTATLKKVLQWATYHKDDWLLLAEDDAAIGVRQPLSSWDAEFFNVDQATIFQLIVAADYLDIKGLMNSACRMVASMIRAKTTDEMRKRLCIRNNFTPSDEQLFSIQATRNSRLYGDHRIPQRIRKQRVCGFSSSGLESLRGPSSGSGKPSLPQAG
ncbi:S-phase kinase-associated protein 1-like isoform X3 [Dermacentor andersoni]|uniref:S-phase kinase-associated protein 1-like isoform X3 n=1 Tax=Dermacentor andersoni TaxID=34620 RepID=UPI002415FD28|nr:S-phase kinase-associated protein 1-like isoform X3 [Dermacentor andersoni]